MQLTSGVQVSLHSTPHLHLCLAVGLAQKWPLHYSAAVPLVGLHPGFAQLLDA